MQRGRWAAVLLLSLFVAGACWGGDDDQPTPTSTPVPLTPSPTTASPSASVAPTRTSTPPPTATAEPTAPATSTPTPPQATGTVVEHGNRGSTQIALTFDMGGRVEPALDIMNWLITNRVPATIFMTGAMAENQNTDAGREVLRLVETNSDLFDLGNHSYTHPDFRDLTAEQMRSELARTEAAVGKVTPTPLRPWFRPPFGGQDADVVRGVAAAGYRYTVMWDIDTIDWRPEADGGPTAAQIVDKVVARAQGGSIVLMHLGGYNTLAALPQIVTGVKARGLQPVTLAAMFGE